MKKYLLLILVYFGLSGHIFAESVARFIMYNAVELAKKEFPGLDADYYFIEKENDTSLYWEVFVDAEPMRGWEHQCYIVSLPKQLGSSGTVRLKKKSLTLPPQGVNLIPIENKNRYGANANAQPRLTPTQNATISNPMAERTYALIISGGISKYSNYDRYWNDCSFIYQTLRKKYGIPKNQIFPIMSDGDNPEEDMLSLSTYEYKSQPLDLDFDGINDIQHAATKKNIKTLLTSLSLRLRANDHLFIYVIDHGGTSDNNKSSYICLWNNEKLYDVELAEMLLPLTNKYVNVNVVLGQCYAGGFIEDLEEIGCVVTAASKGNESSYGCPDIPYDEFVYHWTCAINGADHNNRKVDADVDDNNFITMKEAFKYAKNKDRCNETPLYASSPVSVGADLAFNRFVPSIDLFIRDNWDDTGEVPNMTTDKFWISPSIWCRNQDDGIEEHENPQFTTDHQMAHIYVKIHNRGKQASFGKNWLHLYWAQASTGIRTETWKGRELYNEEDVTGGILEAINIPSIAPGDSAIIKLNWALPRLLEKYPDENFHFCLLARILDTPYDDGYVDGKPYFYVKNSNDQAQKNVTIVKNTNLLSAYNVFVRNTSNESKKYTLELVPRTSKDEVLFNDANVEMEMSPKIYNAWAKGGKHLTGVTCENSQTNAIPKFKFVDKVNKISDIEMSKNEFDKVSLSFKFKQIVMFHSGSFTYDLIQRDDAGNIIGGETFVIEILVYKDPIVIKPNPLPDGSILLSTEDNSYSSYHWENQVGDNIGNEQNIIVVPSISNSNISLTAMSSDGELSTGSISLSSEFGLKSIKKLSDSLVEVELCNDYFENSSLSVVSLLDGLEKMNHVLHGGTKFVDIDISLLPSGLYVINYIVNGEIIDNKKFSK